MGQVTTNVTYAGSTCTVIDPVSGLCIADAFFGDESNTPSGGTGLPGDSGELQALQEWARGTQSDISESGLRQQQQLVLAESLNAGNIPSPLPGLGLTIPDPLKNWLLIGGAVLLGIAVLGNGGRRR